MSTRSQLTKDLNESIKSSVGNKVKILFKNVVRLETKGDKTENRVLVFSPCRILLLTAKVPTKIDTHFHYLEIQSLESKRGNQFSLTVNDKAYSFLCGEDSACSTEVDNMISALNNAIRNIFPTVPLEHIIKKIEVIPSTRLQQLRDFEAVASSRREVGPCGGFSTQYACMCDYHGMTYHEEVAWDVDNIYLSLNNRALCLKDFDYLDQKDLIPIISALEYNTWFTKLRANQVKLSHDNLDRILHVVKKSLNLQELYLDNLNLKTDFMHKFANAVKSNPATSLHTLDFSNNSIEEKGAVYLKECFSRLQDKGLVHVNLSHCGLSSKSVNQLASAFALNTNSVVSVHTTFTHLNLSGNNLKDDVTNLISFLSHSNAIQHLDLSATDIALETLFSALVKGCTTNLVHLNVSKNPFSSKKSKDGQTFSLHFKQFFSTTLNLKHLNMSSCKLPQEALKNLLLGLACNEFTKDLNLDISNNGLGSQGAHVLESCVHGVRCISSLDISDNNMDSDLANVVLAISRNKSLRHLSIARSMKKHMSSIMEAIVQVLQDDECVLRSLSIPDCRVRADLYHLLNALGDNKSLETLDISGNLIGDGGARLLAKALQINDTLRTVACDRNNITVAGYNEIAYALESNRTLQYMPFPIHDVAPCMKASAERTDAAMRRIQDAMRRNAQAQVGSEATRASALQPDFLTASKQQVLERLVAQVRDAIAGLEAESNNDVGHAGSVVQDAESAKQLLVRLQEVAQQRDENHPVEATLRRVSTEIKQSVRDYLLTTIDKMLKCCKEKCPHVLQDDDTVQNIRRNFETQLSTSAVNLCSKEHSEVMKNVQSMCLTIASQLAGEMLDEIYKVLMNSYRILMGGGDSTSAIRIDTSPRRSRLNSSDSSRHDASDISITDSSHQSDHSPMATPHMSIKRKTTHNRKLRPKSVVDSVEGLSADDIPSLLPSSTRHSEEEDSVTELPNATHQLQHLVKGRPRRAKTRAPTRPLVKPPDMTDSISQDLIEGLDTFFRPGSVTPTSEESSFQADGSPNHDFASPLLSDRRTPVLHRNVLMKLNQAPRSRSSDNLEKCSPCSLRKDSESSPLSRRLGEMSQESSDGSLSADTTLEDSGTLSKISSDGSKNEELKSKPALGQKPRPWSVVGDKTDIGLLSDGASTNTSLVNTPDSADALDCPSLGEHPKEVKLKRGGILPNYFPDKNEFFFSRFKAKKTNKGLDDNCNCRSTGSAHE